MKSIGKTSVLKYILIVACIVSFIAACNDKKRNEISLESGLRYEVVQQGTGAKAMEGDEVIIHETMGYTDGTILYSTEDKGVNLPKFVLGRNQVIVGVEEGVKGMRIGEIRKLIIPPELSKREVYPKFISPDSTLVYTIKLMTINKPR